MALPGHAEFVDALSVFAVTLAALAFMAIGLHFSRYKRRKSGCCAAAGGNLGNDYHLVRRSSGSPEPGACDS